MAKNQHYVPQFLLRNWSKDKASIKVFLCQDNETKENAPIKSQAQIKYYYGEDQKIESLLSSLETGMSTVVQKILIGTSKITDDDKRVILHFIAMQYTRTPGRVKKIDDTVTELCKFLLKKDKKIGDKEKIDSMQVSVNNHQYWQLAMYLQSFLMYSDLRIAFLKANSEKKFVIGQDPIVITNKFLKEINWQKSTKGIGLRGVTVFLPISPEFTICLYDNYVYTFKGDRNGYILSNEEVDNLNTYQFLNTENSIYFLQDDENYPKISDMTKDYRMACSAEIIESPVIDNKQIIMTKSNEYPIVPVQNFLPLKERSLFIPRDYSHLERPVIKDSEKYLRNDPRFEKILPPEQ